MKFWGVVATLLGLYVFVEWGVLGRNPLGDVADKAAAAGGSPAPGESWPQSWFGLKNVTLFKHVTAYLSADSGLFGHTAADEVNYLLPAGSRQTVTLPPLPGGQMWAFDYATWSDKVGWEQVWTAPNGGKVAFLHLSAVSTFARGQRVAGGFPVGISGWPLDPASGFGVAGPNNAHLAVVVDELGRQFLDSLAAATSKAS